MIEVDRIMVNDLNINVQLMMEHAGLNLAKLAIQQSQKKKLQQFIVVAGSGNNGGGGIVAARRLKNWGKKVIIWLPKGKPSREVPKLQFERAMNCGVEISFIRPEIDSESLVIDAYIGYNFSGHLDTVSKNAIDFIRQHNCICLDVPSGVDSTNGRNEGQILPLATLTLAWPKSGLLKLENKYLGDLFLADIGIPSWIYNNEKLYYNNESVNNNQIIVLENSFSISSLIQLLYDNKLCKWNIKA